MITIKIGYYGVVLETMKENGIMYLEDKEKDLTSFQAIKKVHEVNNHKGVDQLISACSKAGWMSQNVSNQIRMAMSS